jgi:type VI protein secretion system component Hcp
MCKEKTLEEVKLEYNQYRQHCCPNVENLGFTERNKNVQELFGSHPVSMPSIKEILLETIGTNIFSDVKTFKGIIEMLTEDEIEKNLVEPAKWETVLEHVTDFCIRENREVFVKRSNKFSNLLNSNLIAYESLRKALLALFNVRSTEQQDLYLEVTGSPASIIYMSVDAEFSSCQDWTSNTAYGDTGHNASHSIWANLEDPTMCIAVLRDKEGKKFARSAFRVVHHEGVNYVYMQRIHAMTPHDVIMKQTLDDLVLPDGYTSVPLYDGNRDCIGPIIDYPVKFTLYGYGMVSCEECKNTGEEETNCETCSGDGSVAVTCEECGGENAEDCGFCSGAGTRDADCEDCGGTGNVTQDCSACDGVLYIDAEEHGDIVTPHSDHEEILFDPESIVFLLPEIR